ncbi:MAG: DUF3500 domain-containing protein [Chloroflexota bacterium]
MKKMIIGMGVLSLLMMSCVFGPSIPEIDSTADLSTCTSTGIAEQSSDPDVEALRQAMLNFRASLSEELLLQAQNCLDSERFAYWHNTPPALFGGRHGIAYGDLNSEQLDLFKALLQQFLSSDGYQKLDEITFLVESVLNQEDPRTWSPDNYSIDMFGDPENSGSWGVQVDGHHAVLNFLVHGDAVSIVPAFWGAEPVIGSYNGIDFDVFAAEREAAFAMRNGLSDAELAAATPASAERVLQVGPPAENGVADPFVGNYDYSGFETGLKYSDMSVETKANLEALMQLFVYNLSNPFADVWWNDIAGEIDDTYFVWISPETQLTDSSLIYFRIYNPHLWVEYNVEGEISDASTGGHVHSITRVPSTSGGGDYGIFAQAINENGPRTLLEHYAESDHHTLEHANFDYVLATVHDQ